MSCGTRSRWYGEAFLAGNDMIDVFRYYNPDEVATTFRHRNKTVWARLDRWYAEDDLIESLTPLPVV